ncbi:MAG: hypothetical protein AB7I38_10715 [Dehalococcoidia bacterium]
MAAGYGGHMMAEPFVIEVGDAEPRGRLERTCRPHEATGNEGWERDGPRSGHFVAVTEPKLRYE